MSNSNIRNQVEDKSFDRSGNSRRNFLKKAATASLALANMDLITLTEAGTESGQQEVVELPWYNRVSRWGQTNITEIDPARYDIVWWRKYWKRTQIQGVIINAGGIVAYYPSQIPLHRKAQYLGDRDLFGDLCKAAHEDGLAVFARMDSNRAHAEFYKAHPDWFAIDAKGNPYKAGELFVTCVNGPYYYDHIPAILKEISGKYHPEGFTDNSWSGLGRDSICYCENCRRKFREKTGKEIPLVKNWDDKTYREWIRWNYDRRLEIWELNNRTTKSAGGLNCIWSGMNSGSISGQSRSFRDYKEICKRADIIMLDSQSRSDSSGFQQNADIGKTIHGLLGWNKLIPESMAMYQMGRPTFRLTSKPEPEARMWVIEGMAGSIQPWWHHISAYHEDRRMYQTAEPLFCWHKTNEEYLINREPVANVGVVWSQENTDFYGRDDAEQMVESPIRGITQALLRARIPYLPVHADHIERDARMFSVLVLPNLGVMSDEQVESINRFVENGGSVVATGESSLYNEEGNARPDYALGNLFGAHLAEPHNVHSENSLQNNVGKTFHSYLRLTPELRDRIDGPKTGMEPAVTRDRHPVFRGFDETDILPFGGYIKQLKIDKGAEVLLTYIPEFPAFPPETSWMREPKTDIPGLILNSRPNGSRIVFMPADIDRQYSRYNLPDHGNLLANLIRWASGETIPLAVESPGMLDCHIYKQKNRMVIHLVNLTSTATWRQPVEELMPVGPVRVRIKLEDGISGGNLRLLVSGQDITHTTEKGWFHFEIKSIVDHEVVVIS